MRNERKVYMLLQPIIIKRGDNMSLKRRNGHNDDVDWYQDVFQKKWTRKYGEVIDPHTREILAHVVLNVNDFTRRAVLIKMTKWLGQYATDQHMAGYILNRLSRPSAAVFAGDGSWVRLNRTR